ERFHALKGLNLMQTALFGRFRLFIVWVCVFVMLAQGQLACAEANFDLSSPERTWSSGHESPVTILVENNARTITPTEDITAAELAALHQILSTGRQTLQVNAAGVAHGGELHLSPHLTDNASGLVVPKGVSVFQNAALTPTLNFAGNFV